MDYGVVLVVGRSENIDDMRKDVASSLFSLKGVLNPAVVLRDGPFWDMSWSD